MSTPEELDQMLPAFLIYVRDGIPCTVGADLLRRAVEKGYVYGPNIGTEITPEGRALLEGLKL